MAETKPLLNTKEILQHYVQAIDNAKSECIIATPYYQSIPELENAIERAEKRGIRIKIYGRMGEEEQFEELRSYENVELHFIERLHAKIVRNEKEIAYSSMNLTESSVDINVETGTYSTDSAFIQKFENEYNWLKIISIPKQEKKVFKNSFSQQYCERCGRPKRYKPNEPLCLDCYDDTIVEDIEKGYNSRNYGSYYRQNFEYGYNHGRRNSGYGDYGYNGYGNRGRGGYGGRGRGGYGGYGGGRYGGW